MDFLDPKKHKAHLVRLAIGYILIGIALVLTAIILLYRAYGFGIKNGEVIQNGLIFVSSRPNPADMYVNGQKHEKTTNARLLMPAGQYTVELRRDGYRSWRRAINIEGGTLARFDYPVLFPTTLTTTAVKRYSTRPALFTKSQDRRWLLTQGAADFNAFDLYDLGRDESEIAASPVTLPKSLFTLAAGTHSWELVEWAADNRRVLLKHTTNNGGKLAGEYMLIDRQAPAESVNLTRTLQLTPGAQLTLRDKRHDNYFVYTPANKRLAVASLNKPVPRTLQDNVLSFKTHGKDMILYATTQGEAAGKAAIKLLDGDRIYTIRRVSLGSAYLLDIARYEDNWYIVAGSPKDDRVYVYRNPVAQLRDNPDSPLVPIHVFKVAKAAYVSFSDNARFVMAQAGQRFTVYDAETNRGYAYTVAAPIDPSQKHAEWMDGHRMTYVSGGKTYVFEFDNANRETLNAAEAGFTPVFDSNFGNVYTIAEQQKTTTGKAVTTYVLQRTPLVAPQDQ